MGAKQRPPQSGNVSADSQPEFVPLEETLRRPRANSDPTHDKAESTRKAKTSQSPRIKLPKVDGKKLVLSCIGLFFLVVVYESFFVDPEDRLIQPDFADKFLLWVEIHPGLGIGAIMVVIAIAVVTLIPIGTPLTLGCGYIYRGVYGWKMGIFVSTAVSMLGSCLGAVICFLLGRYLMRETVQQWVRKYPLFDAINVGKLRVMATLHKHVVYAFDFDSQHAWRRSTAAKEQGFKIMAMLYLTPVIPLGLVSYMCGTTSMNLHAFAFAKIFALPLYLIYTFMGASAHSFVKRGTKEEATPGISASDQAKQLEENQVLLVSGLVLSIVMMSLITRHIRKELMKVSQPRRCGTCLLVHYISYQSCLFLCFALF